MTEEEMKSWAATLVAIDNEDREYCLVYEHEDLLDEIEDLDEEEQDKIMRQIYDYMSDAKLTITIDGTVYE